MLREIDSRETQIRAEPPSSDHHKNLIACQVACPVHTDARGYVRAIADGDFERAYLIARGPNPFASICGRVCGAPCESSCRRGKIPRTDDDGSFVAFDRPIAIRALKRFVCESYGAEARPAAEILAALSNHLPGVAADAEEMASLLHAAVQGTFGPARGERVEGKWAPVPPKPRVETLVPAADARKAIWRWRKR